MALEATGTYCRLWPGKFFPKKLYLLEIHVNKEYHRITIGWGPMPGPGSLAVGFLPEPNCHSSHKKMAFGQRPFNSIILGCLSNHSENTGGVLLIIKRESTIGETPLR
jgi:hypothetical protein